MSISFLASSGWDGRSGCVSSLGWNSRNTTGRPTARPSRQPSDRAQAHAARQCDAEPGTHPVDVLLIVERDDPPRTAGLREEAVEAIERADVEHTTARKTIRTEHGEAVAVVAGDPRRVDPGASANV
jgi:hypothetical protein